MSNTVFEVELEIPEPIVRRVLEGIFPCLETVSLRKLIPEGVGHRGRVQVRDAHSVKSVPVQILTYKKSSGTLLKICVFDPPNHPPLPQEECRNIAKMIVQEIRRRASSEALAESTSKAGVELVESEESSTRKDEKVCIRKVFCG